MRSVNNRALQKPLIYLRSIDPLAVLLAIHLNQIHTWLGPTLKNYKRKRYQSYLNSRQSQPALFKNKSNRDNMGNINA